MDYTNLFELRPVNEDSLPPKTKGRQKTGYEHFYLAKTIFSKFAKSEHDCVEVWLKKDLSEARNLRYLASNLNVWFGDEIQAFTRTVDIDEQLSYYFPMLEGRVRFLRLYIKKREA